MKYFAVVFLLLAIALIVIVFDIAGPIPPLETFRCFIGISMAFSLLSLAWKKP